jgi:hypothetical protein
VTFAESLARTSSRSRTITDSVTFSESVARIRALTGRTATDSVTFSETAVGFKVVIRTGTDTLTFSDTATKGAVGLVRPRTDTVTLTDSAARAAYARVRALVDTVTFADIVTSSGGAFVPDTNPFPLTYTERPGLVVIEFAAHTYREPAVLTVTDTPSLRYSER